MRLLRSSPSSPRRLATALMIEKRYSLSEDAYCRLPRSKFATKHKHRKWSPRYDGHDDEIHGVVGDKKRPREKEAKLPSRGEPHQTPRHPPVQRASVRLSLSNHIILPLILLIGKSMEPLIGLYASLDKISHKISFLEYPGTMAKAMSLEIIGT